MYQLLVPTVAVDRLRSFLFYIARSKMAGMNESYKYEIVPGYFLDDTKGIDAPVERTDALPARFGLLDTSENRWSILEQKLKQLRQEAPQGTQYKALIIGRHGEGYHNLATLKYGREAWEKHWRYLYTDGEIVWGPDPELTPLGISEAGEVNALWKKELKAGMPIPDKLFSSSFTRAVHTCQITFGDIILDNGTRRPLVLEMLHETLGVNTCDKRGSISKLKARFPNFDMEDGITEEDELWTPDHRETLPEHMIREQKAFDQIFNSENQEQMFISITCHSMTLCAMVAVMGRLRFWVPPGGIIAFVVKATLVT